MFSIKHLLPKFKPHSFHDKKMMVLWLRYLTEIDEKTRKATRGAPGESQDTQSA